MSRPDGPIKGRGAGHNPAPRYDATATEAVDDGWEREPEPNPATQVLTDSSRSILSYNDSPDIPFDRSINPYKGCEHGCVYCFARPTHAYLGLSPGLDFETRIFAKPNAAELLKRELARSGYRCAPIALGANTDPYQPVERRLKITRQLLEVLRDCHHPVTIVTKSALVERDLDILAPMAADRLAQVAVSVTSLDPHLSRRLEPRAVSPARRLQAIRTLSQAGVPVTVLFAPVIPALNDHELEDVLAAVKEAGAVSAGYVMLRLPLEVDPLFQDWLALHEPLKAAHVMSLVRQMREGKNYQAEFGTRMAGKGVFAQLIAQRFQLACRKLGLGGRSLALDSTRFTPPREEGPQLALF